MPALWHIHLHKKRTTQSTAPKSQVSTSFTGLEEEEIGAIIREYLMENPEVIIEAVNAYSERERLAEETRTRENATANIDGLLNAESGLSLAKTPQLPKSLSSKCSTITVDFVNVRRRLLKRSPKRMPT